MKLIILGKQGCGKGTQGKLVAEKYRIQHIAMGDLFREIAKSDSEFAQKVKAIMGKGALVPDELVIEILLKGLEGKEKFILDGFPRNLHQAEKLQEAKEIDAVILLDISDQEAIKRLSARRNCKKCGEIFNVLTKPPKQEGICDKCGNELFQRDDDKEEAIRKRLSVYKQQTEPLLNFYQEKGILKKVNGEQEIEDIFKDICSILDELTK